MANLIKFYEGGLSYTEAKNMTIDELVELNKYATRINNKIKQEMRNTR